MPLDVRTVNLNDTVSGSLDMPGATDELRFTATAGQRAYVDLMQLTGSGVITFSLQDASGKELGGSAAGVGGSGDGADFQDAVTLPADGEYKLVVDGIRSAVADYTLKLIDAPLDVRRVDFGAVINDGSLQVPGATDEYRFTAAAGDRLLLDVKQLTGIGVVTFSLLDASGTLLGSSAAGVGGSGDGADFQNAVNLPAAGEYKLVVDGIRSAVADYQLDICREGKALVSGTAWSAGFRTAVHNAGLGDAGYDIHAAGQRLPIPWTNVNQVAIVFDREFNPQQSDLTAKGRVGGDYPVAGFAYDAATRTGTWTFSRPFTNDLVTINAGHGVYVQFNVLPGDVDQSAGAVNATDLVLTRNRIGRSIQNPGSGATIYKPFNDLNADGVINASDLVLVRNRIGTQFIGPQALAELFNDRAIGSRRAIEDAMD